MIYSVSYADERMTQSLDLNTASAKKNGVDYRSVRIRLSIQHEKCFYDSNKDILNSKRGSGFWLWKPYIIYNLILDLKDGDILIYSDAGIEFIAPVQHIIDRMDQDIFFFTNGFPQVEWCKGNVMRAINGWHKYENFTHHKQVQASVIFFKVNENTKRFVKEWLLWCQMPGFIDDSPSPVENFATFADHRHDQAILTALQIKYGYKLHWWPTQYSMHLERPPEDDYPCMFNHHRKRNPGMGEGDAEW